MAEEDDKGPGSPNEDEIGLAAIPAAAAHSAVVNVERKRSQEERNRRHKMIATANNDCLVHALLEVQREIGIDTSSPASTFAAIPGPDAHGTKQNSSAYRNVFNPNSNNNVSNGNGKTTTSARRPSRIRGTESSVDLSSLNSQKPLPILSLGNGSQSRRPSVDGRNHLTDKNLANVSVAIRDLSKYLGSLHIKLLAKRLMVVCKIFDDDVIRETAELVSNLLSLKNSEGKGRYEIHIQDVLREDPVFKLSKIIAQDEGYEHRLRFWKYENCRSHPHMFDAVVTVGGDGTVLFASWLFQKVVPPVIGFKAGTLGFLTKFELEYWDQAMKTIVQEGVVCSLRMRFECTIMRSKRARGLLIDGEVQDESKTLDEELEEASLAGNYELTHTLDQQFTILNDIVVDRGPNPKMTSTELYGDDEHLTSIEADGVVVSTPTGSTAYSMAAGGSLLHPIVPGILISPICPHTLSFRPLVVPDTMDIKIGVPYDARSEVYCSFDGHKRIQLHIGDYVKVNASKYPFPLIQTSGRNDDWFLGLSNTLHWNERKRQKAYSGRFADAERKSADN